MSKKNIVSEEQLTIRSLIPFHLKDKQGRGGMRINMMRSFGFVPEEILVQKMEGQNNRIVVSAILTAAQLKIEQVAKKTLEKKGKTKKV